MKKLLKAILLAGLAMLPINNVRAEGWPTKPVTLVVPFTAGTTSDVIARSFAEYLSTKLGVGVVVENKGGAGGNIGAAAVVHAVPDGYTLLFATTGQAATNKLMYKEMSFDPQKDLLPIGLVGKSPIIIVARQKLPAASLQEFIDAAKKPGASFTVGYPGNGTLGHITGSMLQTKAGVKLAEAQYRGSAQIMTDLLGDHIDLGMDSMAAYVPQIEAGTIKALAIASSKRWPKLPQVPTASESGLPNFEAGVWYAVLGPKGTPDSVLDKINANINAYLGEEKTRTLFTDFGIETGGGSAADLKTFIESEIVKWGPVIKAAGIDF
jgi:tripartite-type tricarboxylate transporter receptor subunit TctC